MADIFDIPVKDPDEFHFGYLQDTDDNTETSLRYYRLTESFIRFSAGYSEIHTAASFESINSDKAYISIGSDPYQQFTIEFQYEQWHAAGSLNIDSTRASFQINLDKSSLSLGAQNRAIELFTRPGAPRDRLDLKSQDLIFNYDYYGFNDWLFNLNIIDYSYSNNINISQLKPAVLLLLQPSALTLASGFEDKSSSLKISRLLDTKAIGLSYTESRSAIDDGLLSGYTLEFSKRIDNDIQLLLSYGKSKSSHSNSDTEFYHISLTYYFD